MKKEDLLWVLIAAVLTVCICSLVGGAIFFQNRKAVLAIPGKLPAPSTPPMVAPTTVVSDQPLGKIVFTCQMAGDQICIMNADGSDMRQLTSDGVQHWYASLAPDGNSVIYSAYREPNVYELYEMTFDRVVTQLTDRLGVLKAPEVSPDGRLIVFGLGEAEGHESIWVMSRDGTDAHIVYGQPQGNGWDPTWSPDGGQILFASYTEDGEVQLFVVNLDGSGLLQVSHLNSIRGRSDWSSDGMNIGTYAGDSWLWELFFMSPDGSNLHQMTNGGNNLAPSYSPDGEWVTFTSYMDNYQDANGCEIYIMRVDGSQITRLTYNNYCDWQPRWGP